MTKRQIHAWSNADEAYLIENYGKTPAAIMAAHVGVSRCALYTRAREMGIAHLRTPREWTATEAAYLRRHYGKTPVKDIATALGRKPEAVSYKACQLGIARRVTNRCEWTPERVAYLREHYGTTSAELIAARLGTTPHAVSTHASRLGIRKVHRSTIHPGQASLREIAKEAAPKPVEAAPAKVARGKTWDEGHDDRHRRRWQRAKEIERLLEGNPERADAPALVDEYNALARQLTGFSVPARYRL